MSPQPSRDPGDKTGEAMGGMVGEKQGEAAAMTTCKTGRTKGVIGECQLVIAGAWGTFGIPVHVPMWAMGPWKTGAQGTQSQGNILVTGSPGYEHLNSPPQQPEAPPLPPLPPPPQP